MREISATLYTFMDKYMSLKNVTSHIGVTDIVEIIIIAIVLYNIMVWVKNTRAWMLFKGIVVILIFLLVAVALQMNTILWLAGKVVNVAAIALVVIFQPELRSALERLGRKNFLTSFLGIDFQKANVERFSEKTITELVKACYEMGKVKTGALIVVEREMMLNEYIRTGIALDSLVSSQLLINIFEHNTPLHDGAIIVRGDRIVSATCYLPLSDNMELSKELGTRHRAAVGISEVSDSMTIVVSEETGGVSLAMDGTLYRNVDADFLKSKLKFAAKLTNEQGKYLEKLKRRLKNVAKADKVDYK
jgi:diadenylate cyclase